MKIMELIDYVAIISALGVIGALVFNGITNVIKKVVTIKFSKI